MSVYLKTKPRWCPTAIATDRGWVNPTSGEVLVSLRGLKSRMEAETPAAPVVEVAPVVAPIKEVKIKKPKKGQQIIGETIEFPNVDMLGE